MLDLARRVQAQGGTLNPVKSGGIVLFGLRLPQLVKIIPAQEIRHLIELAHRPGHGGHQCVHVQQATARGFDRAVINTKRPANLGDMYRPGLAGRDVEQDVLQVVLVIYLRVYGTAVFPGVLDQEGPGLENLGDAFIRSYQATGDALAQADHGKPEALDCCSCEQQLHFPGNPCNCLHAFGNIATTQRHLGSLEVECEHRIGTAFDFVI